MRKHKHRWRDIVNWFSPTFSSIKVQEDPTEESPDSYTELTPNGPQLTGDSTVWEDIQASLIGRRLFSNNGTVDYDYDFNALSFQRRGTIDDNNDCVIWNYQTPHSAKLDGNLNLHMHWIQQTSDTREFTVQHRIVPNGQPFVDTWITTIVDTNTNNAFTYPGGSFMQITRLVDISLVGAGLSTQIQFRLTRTDRDLSDRVLVTFVDGHVERDSMGSRLEFVK